MRTNWHHRHHRRHEYHGDLKRGVHHRGPRYWHGHHYRKYVQLHAAHHDGGGHGFHHELSLQALLHASKQNCTAIFDKHGNRIGSKRADEWGHEGCIHAVADAIERAGGSRPHAPNAIAFGEVLKKHYGFEAMPAGTQPAPGDVIINVGVNKEGKHSSDVAIRGDDHKNRADAVFADLSPYGTTYRTTILRNTNLFNQAMENAHQYAKNQSMPRNVSAYVANAASMENIPGHRAIEKSFHINPNRYGSAAAAAHKGLRPHIS